MLVEARLAHQDLPADVAVVRARVREGLSELFDAEVVFVTQDGAVDLNALLWSGAALTLTPAQATESAPRSFHGTIEEASYLGFDRTYYRYRLRLRPQIHGLAYRVRTRIFQNKNAVDIVKQVFTDAGIPDAGVVWDTAGDYPVREYCTQWKESELAFVLRLLEEEGIFYWFEHTDADHVLHLGDAPDVHVPIEGNSTIAGRHHADQNEESVWEVVHQTRLVHDAFRTRDWQFTQPADPLQASTGDGVNLRYDYPGLYGATEEGARLVAVRYQEQQVGLMRLDGHTSCLRFQPGRTASLARLSPPLLEGDWLVRSLEHRFDCGERREGGVSGVGAHEARFSAIPVDIPFRPPRRTPKPRAYGLESAVVTGPSGEEIHVDEYGRIKVHFYWDRENPVDDTASCWMRVQQLNTSGAMILPRVGWEMHVAFVDGDPDRPVALHKAYNQETMPPYAQPGNKTQSALQSSTSPGGGSTNEIRLQDGNGGMEWSLHASKDLNVVVANDENETIDVDSTESVGAAMSALVGGDETGDVGANQSTSVSGNAALETVGSKTVSVSGNDDWGITGNFGFTTTGDRTEDISGLMNVLANKVSETFNAAHTRTVGAVQAIVSATAISETVGGSKTESVGAAKAIITPKDHSESLQSTKTLTSGAALFKTGGDISYTAKGALALTAAGAILIKAGADCMITGRNVIVTSGSAKFKGGGGTFKLGGSITIDANQFGGKSGPMLEIKGTIDYKD